MELSIIIIGYNASKELKNCLLSIKKQTSFNKKIEIIYVDDGSLDNSVEIFNSFVLTFPKKCIQHKKNLGRNYARNSGIKNSSGNWCLFINSNIVLSQNVINNYLNEIKNSDFNLITGNINYTCKDKKFEFYLNSNKRGTNGYKTKSLIPFYYLLFSNACIKKSILNKKTFDSEFISYGGSEMEVSYRLNKKNSILFIPNTQVLRLNHPSLIDHLKRLEEFGKNNIYFLYKKININDLPKVYKFFNLFFNKISIIFYPFFYFIRFLLLIIIRLFPNNSSHYLIKLILGFSIIIGITNNKHLFK